MLTQRLYSSLEDFLISKPATVDGEIDDGWGAMFPVKGRELEATILFADIPGFTARTEELTPTETLVFVNNFFAWISAEALQGFTCLVDKYIGDEIMLVFSSEFGGRDSFGEALDAARRIGDNQVLGFDPQIGLASGRVVVGYVGTPLKYNCSVFGRPVTIAARCAKVRPPEINRPFASRIIFPSSVWEDRSFENEFPPRKYKGPDGMERERAMTWQMNAPRTVDVKNVGPMEVTEIINFAMWATSIAAEDRARLGVEALRRSGRYWPLP